MSFRHQQWAKNRIRNVDGLTANERLVLLIIGDLTHEHDCIATLTNSELEKRTGASLRTIKGALKGLERRHLITVQGVKGYRTHVLFPVPADYNEHADPKSGQVSSIDMSDAPEEERKKLANDLYFKQTGVPWYAPCESEEEYYALKALFDECPREERFNLLRQITGVGLDQLGRSLPYDKERREQ